MKRATRAQIGTGPERRPWKLQAVQQSGVLPKTFPSSVFDYRYVFEHAAADAEFAMASFRPPFQVALALRFIESPPAPTSALMAADCGPMRRATAPCFDASCSTLAPRRGQRHGELQRNDFFGSGRAGHRDRATVAMERLRRFIDRSGCATQSPLRTAANNRRCACSGEARVENRSVLRQTRSSAHDQPGFGLRRSAMCVPHPDAGRSRRPVSADAPLSADAAGVRRRPVFQRQWLPRTHRCRPTLRPRSMRRLQALADGVLTPRHVCTRCSPGSQLAGLRVKGQGHPARRARMTCCWCGCRRVTSLPSSARSPAPSGCSPGHSSCGATRTEGPT